MFNKKEKFSVIVLKSDETKFLSYSQIADYDSRDGKNFIMQYKEYDSEETIRFKPNTKQGDLIFQLQSYGSKEVETLISLGRIAEVEIDMNIKVKDDFLIDESIVLHGISNSDIKIYHVSNVLHSKPCYDYIMNLNTVRAVSKDGALGLHCTNKPYEQILNLSTIKDMSSIHIYDVVISNVATVKFIEEIEYSRMIESYLSDISVLNKKLLDQGVDVLFIYTRKEGIEISVTNSVVLNLSAIEFNHSKNPKNTNLDLTIHTW